MSITFPVGLRKAYYENCLMESSEQYSSCNFSHYSSHTLPNLFQFLAPEQLTLQVGKCIPMLGSPWAWGLLTKWDSKPAASASLWRQSAGEPRLASEPSALFWSLHSSGPHSGSVTHFLILPCLRDLPHPLEISVAFKDQLTSHLLHPAVLHWFCPWLLFPISVPAHH